MFWLNLPNTTVISFWFSLDNKLLPGFLNNKKNYDKLNIKLNL